MKDQETNAMIPIVQPYSETLQGKEVSGNYLFIRDKETNAMIPVVCEYVAGDLYEVCANMLYKRDKQTNALVSVVSKYVVGRCNRH